MKIIFLGFLFFCFPKSVDASLLCQHLFTDSTYYKVSPELLNTFYLSPLTVQEVTFMSPVGVPMHALVNFETLLVLAQLAEVKGIYKNSESELNFENPND